MKKDRPTYYGKYRGIVRDIVDPEKRGRLRAVVPEVSSDVVLDWALPCFPYGGSDFQFASTKTLGPQGGYGFFYVPELESGVWIEFESGDINRPIWVGVFHSKPSVSGVPIDNVPAEALTKTNPDTDELDYPIERVRKAERNRDVSARRHVIELDTLATLTNPWDDRETYQMPKVEVGKRGGTDEPVGDIDKNVFDVGISARDSTTDTERDEVTTAERHITHIAGDTGVSATANTYGDISHTADNTFVNKALGTAAVNDDTDTPGEVYTGDAPSGKMRLSSGNDPQEDTANVYEAAHRVNTTTIKLTGSHAKLQSSEFDTVIRAGTDVYIRAGNGLLAEVSGSTGLGSNQVKKLSQIHTLDSSYPSQSTPTSHVPSHEVGKPSASVSGVSTGYTGPSQTSGTSPTRYFLKYLDERAIKPYNEHWHRVDIPEDEDDGGDPDPDPGTGPDIDIDDVDWFDGVLDMYTNNSIDSTGVGNNGVFPDGVWSQVMSLAGTASTKTDPETGQQLIGAIDALAITLEMVMDHLAQEFYALGSASDLVGLFNAPVSGASNFDTKAESGYINSALNKAYGGNGTTPLAKVPQIAGKDYSAVGPLVRMNIRKIGLKGSVGRVAEFLPLKSTVADENNSKAFRSSQQIGLIQKGIYGGIGYIPENGEYVGSGAGPLGGYISFPAINMHHPSFTKLYGNFGTPEMKSTYPTQTITTGGGGNGTQFSGSPVSCQDPGFEYTNPVSATCFSVYTSNVVPENRWAPENPDGRVAEDGLNNFATVSQDTSPHKVTTEYAQAN